MSEHRQFQETVWGYFHDYGRVFPWREPLPNGQFDPYRILVSEIMLQQTQTSRVVPKYLEFIQRFKDTTSLAGSSLGEVLDVWVGLGYNRRAKFLWQSAQYVQENYEGLIPREIDDLVMLPGVGVNTAGAIQAYAYNQPAVFIETNIRTVYIHHFFQEQTAVDDKELRPLVADTLDREHPREWYWALMDYGVFLKSTEGNKSRESRHYTKQSTFQGSKRQIRGQIIRMLRESPHTEAEICTLLSDIRTAETIADLLKEQLIRRQNGKLIL